MSSHSCLFNDSALSDQVLIFREQVVHVHRHILSAHSQHFQSLWSVESDSSLDFTFLNVSEASFISSIQAMYGSQVDVTEINAYDLFYLAHYFQITCLITLVEELLIQHFPNWTWIQKFLLRADENQDLNAIKFVGPYFDMVNDIHLEIGLALRSDSIKTLTESCLKKLSQTWLVKSLVVSIKHLIIELSQFLNIIDLFNFEVFSFNDWKELLLSL
ncbi:hypothetical protein GEMRC1_007243 [Eukaryota sp. GEM-RC1]